MARPAVIAAFATIVASCNTFDEFQFFTSLSSSCPSVSISLLPFYFPPCLSLLTPFRHQLLCSPSLSYVSFPLCSVSLSRLTDKLTVTYYYMIVRCLVISNLCHQICLER